MALPKRRHSHARTHKRRAHDALNPTTIATCPKCQAPKLPHRLCGGCGFYKDRSVIRMDEVES
ncbi:MAG: 50S ribosomal protein L32 [Thermodesulfobacteriota bacterium]